MLNTKKSNLTVVYPVFGANNFNLTLFDQCADDFILSNFLGCITDVFILAGFVNIFAAFDLTMGLTNFIGDGFYAAVDIATVNRRFNGTAFSCPRTTISGTCRCSAPYSTLPIPTSSRTFPAVLMTKISPSP